MDTGYVLTDRDLEKIRRMVDDVIARRVNTTGRVGELRVDLQELLLPEVYIGRAPYGGIPAMTLMCGTGTGSCFIDPEELPDEPGYADCVMHRIRDERDLSGETAPGVIQVPAEPKRVYNLFNEDIPEGAYVIAIRDKFGSYLAIRVLDGSSDDADFLTECSGGILRLFERQSDGSYLYVRDLGVVCDWDSYFGTGTGSPPVSSFPNGTKSPLVVESVHKVCKTLAPCRTVTEDTTLLVTDALVQVDASAGDVTVTLPAWHAAGHYKIVRIDDSANVVTIQRAGSDLINGATSFTLDAQWDWADVNARCVAGSLGGWVALVAASVGTGGGTDHGALSGLADDDHTQYALLGGRAGGQTLYGGTAATNTLVLYANTAGANNVLTLSDDGIFVGGVTSFYLPELSSSSAAVVGFASVYPKNDGHLYVKNGGGTERRLTLPTELDTVTTGTWNGSVIAEAYGGTGFTTYTLGDTLYSDATNSLGKLAGNTTTTKQFLTQTGTGSASAAPAWGTIVVGDLPALNGFTNATAALDDRVPIYDTSATANRDSSAQEVVSVGLLGSSNVDTNESLSGINTVLDLATTQHITFTLAAAATVVVTASVRCGHSVAGAIAQIYFDVDGTPYYVSGTTCTTANVTFAMAAVRAFSLSAGTHTIKLQFATASNTCSFATRNIVVSLQ